MMSARIHCHRNYKRIQHLSARIATRVCRSLEYADLQDSYRVLFHLVLQQLLGNLCALGLISFSLEVNNGCGCFKILISLGATFQSGYLSTVASMHAFLAGLSRLYYTVPVLLHALALSVSGTWLTLPEVEVPHFIGGSLGGVPSPIRWSLIRSFESVG